MPQVWHAIHPRLSHTLDLPAMPELKARRVTMSDTANVISMTWEQRIDYEKRAYLLNEPGVEITHTDKCICFTCNRDRHMAMALAAFDIRWSRK